MFTFYFAILSIVIPPIALSVYAAPGISGESMWKTGTEAFQPTLGSLGEWPTVDKGWGLAARLVLFLGAVFLVVPEMITDLIGVVVFVGILAEQVRRQRHLLSHGRTSS